MTLEAQNRAIAEWLGWTELSNTNVPHVPLSGRDPDGCMNRVPNYTGSLDAMHEAEKTLKDTPAINYWYSYFQHLSAVCGNAKDDNVRLYACIVATAAQRAEAFLRAVGRWKEKGEK